MKQDSPNFVNRKILIIDESPIELTTLTELLSFHGYQLEIVSNGVLGLKAAIENPPDLILLESLMLGVNGYEVCQALKSLPDTQGVPIIFLGTLHEEQEVIKAFEVGGCDYISKPVAALEMLTRINYQLSINPNQHLAPQSTQTQLLELAILHANDAIIITDAHTDDWQNLNIIFVNQAFSQLTGYKANEVLGQSPQLLQGTHTNPASHAKIQAAIQQAKPVRVESLNCAKNGTEFWVEISLTPLKNDQKIVTHWLAVEREISERKWIEEETLRCLVREHEHNELKSHFVSMVSHEYRIPLTTILSSIDLLEFYGHRSTSEEKKELFAQIRTAIDRMTNLMNKVTTLEHSELDCVPFKPKLLELKPFCEIFVQECHGLLGAEHEIQFIFQGQNTAGYIDETLLRSILTNLFSNAVKYSPEGGTITFKVSCHNQTATFSIQDQGIGIPPEAMQNLFHSFYRAENVDHISGTGLGLSIVKQFVESHNGHIEWESHLNQGSTFTVTIPLNASSSCKAPMELAPVHSSTSSF